MDKEYVKTDIYELKNAGDFDRVHNAQITLHKGATYGTLLVTYEMHGKKTHCYTGKGLRGCKYIFTMLCGKEAKAKWGKWEENPNPTR